MSACWAFFVAVALLPHPHPHRPSTRCSTCSTRFFALIFLVDFFIRLSRAANRTTYLRSWGWFDLITSIPGLPFLRILRAARVIHSRRALLATTSDDIIIQARESLAQSTLLFVAAAGLLVLTAGCIAITMAEAEAPGANITTGGDAIWWAIVTIATVGYGDLYPVTSHGRVIGTFIIVLGVALFTVLTSYLATIFMSSDRRFRANRLPRDFSSSDPADPAAPAGDTAAALQALTARIAALEELLQDKEQ